jgi:hypothetical protein
MGIAAASATAARARVSIETVVSFVPPKLSRNGRVGLGREASAS